MATDVKLTTVTVGTKLQGFRQELDQFVREEMPKIDDYKCPLIENANDVGLAIDQVSNLCDYNGELSKAEDGASETLRGYFRTIESLLKDLKGKQAIDLTNLSSRAKQLVNSLPFDRSWQPKLSGCSPQYSYVTDGEFEIMFAGTFRGPISLKDKIKLIIEGAKTSLLEAIETSLKFKVTELPELPEQEREKARKCCRFVRCSLELQYNAASGITSVVKSNIKTATYHVWVGIFPSSPGEITFGERVKRIEEKHTRSAQVTFSREGATQTGDIVHTVCFPPTEGWKIVSKPRLIVDGGEPKELEMNEGPVIARVNLPEGSDVVSAHVEFDEKRETFEAEEGAKKIWLQWGQSHEFTSQTLAVTLDTFDKRKLQFKGVDETKPFLKIKNVGEGAYRLIAEAPSQDKK